MCNLVAGSVSQSGRANFSICNRCAFCAIILVVIVAFVIGGGRIARHVVAETIVASFATVVNVERKSLSKNHRVAFLANAVNVEEAW